MYFFKDKDIINESLIKTKKRQEKLKKVLSLLMAFDVVCMSAAFSTTLKYDLDHKNPFSGSSISSNNFLSNYKEFKSRYFFEDDSFKNIIKSMKESDISEEKAYILYEAVLSNENLNEEDRKNLCGFLQYFIDNKYLDDEYVYKKLSTIKRSENNPDMSDAAGCYVREYNSIILKDDEYYDYAFSHETFHGEDKSGEILKYGDYSWFLEGMTTVLNYEYCDKKDGYYIQPAFIRVLCELV